MITLARLGEALLKILRTSSNLASPFSHPSISTLRKSTSLLYASKIAKYEHAAYALLNLSDLPSGQSLSLIS